MHWVQKEFDGDTNRDVEGKFRTVGGWVSVNVVGGGDLGAFTCSKPIFGVIL